MSLPTVSPPSASTSSDDLVVLRPEGLYCPPADLYIDPWRPVARAVLTHGHADHARRGHGACLAHADSAGVLRARLGADVPLQTLAYGETLDLHGVRLSLHPAGHVLGSAQVRLAHRGRVWVASGDYKLDPDPTCTPFEPVRCDVFITESTFGLPIYRWPDPAEVLAGLGEWWAANAAQGRPTVVYAYSFGKAQRVLMGVKEAESAGVGPLLVHGAMEAMNAAYRAQGVALPPTCPAIGHGLSAAEVARALVLAPPSAAGSAWLRRFPAHADAFASGWMRVRGARRRRGVDRGVVLSDHADWPGLQRAIQATGASRVIVTHGQKDVMVRWLQSQGLQAEQFTTAYATGDDGDEEGADHGAVDPVVGGGNELGAIA